jgi:short subunit dehydrogenase-like uncharacterized protein
VIDLGDAESVTRAVRGRALVCATAGPFGLIGEPVLAACARLGVHYVDTTGEQPFVADAVARYRATAEASGACVAPAMAYEIAPADWGAHLAAEALGDPEEISIAYALPGALTTRGTRKSALGVIERGETRQLVHGKLVDDGVVVRQITLRDGKRVRAVSFPSPEAVVVGDHTGARTVRTFMVMSGVAVSAIRATRKIAPVVIRATRRLLDRAIDRGPEGPDAQTRERSSFEIVCEAKKGDRVATVRVMGSDPYGLTAEIQALCAARAMAGQITARGVVAPSLVIPPREALEALGLEVHGP